ncbi:hypothetical protein AB0M36_33310 [Actinoplanes sp. NPDC051346]|uniref:hypothetical protein n=1 Tax=Actinoplanes sp. NPDC051346 TaxID=3155048 RepID=UPI003422DD32
MTEPNDDLRSIADPGGPDPESGGDLSYDEVHQDEEPPAAPGEPADRPPDNSPAG